MRVRKEKYIVAEIQRQVPELDDFYLTEDCRIPGQASSLSRPDIVWKVNDTLIRVEIDEDGPNHEYDQSRIVGSHAASHYTNHVLIRFDPDKSSENNPLRFKKVKVSNGEMGIH